MTNSSLVSPELAPKLYNAPPAIEILPLKVEFTIVPSAKIPPFMITPIAPPYIPVAVLFEKLLLLIKKLTVPSLFPIK